MPFDVLEMSLTVLDQLAPLETKVRQRRKSLADEIGRAAESVALNVSEARQRAGLDRADLFRRASGRPASSPRHCASRAPAATSRRPTSRRSRPASTGCAPCCGGSPTEP